MVKCKTRVGGTGTTRTRTTKHDWGAVRDLYVRGEEPPEGSNTQGARLWFTLEQVAQRFGIPFRLVTDHSYREGWNDQREEFRRELRARSDEGMLEQLAAQYVRARMAFFGTAMRGQQMVDRKLRNDDLNETGIQRLMTALRSAQQVMDVAQGRPAGGDDAAGGTVNNFWLAFLRDPTPAVREALVVIDGEALPPMGIVAGPGRS